MIDHKEIKFTVMYEASAWKQEGDVFVRRWSNPPSKEPDDDVAARVKKKGNYWPFKKYTWAVWSPSENDALLEGEETAEDAAMKAADEALLSLVAGAGL